MLSYYNNIYYLLTIKSLQNDIFLSAYSKHYHIQTKLIISDFNCIKATTLTQKQFIHFLLVLIFF